MMAFKRKRLAGKDAPNLKRFRASVQAFVHSQKDATDQETFIREDSKDQRAFPVPKPVRKEQRKLKRKLKRQRKHAFMQHKSTTVDIRESPRQQAPTERGRKNNEKRKREREKKKTRARSEDAKQREEVRIEALLAANKKEERMIVQLERQLKINKRKSKSLPKAFIDDGLDYLDDVVNPEKLKTLYENESEKHLDGLYNVDTDSSACGKMVKSQNKKKTFKNNVSENNEGDNEDDLNLDDEEDSQDDLDIDDEEDSQDDPDLDEEDNRDDLDIDDDHEGRSSKCDDKTQGNKNHSDCSGDEYEEDIYGRVRDKLGVYVPPPRRAAMAVNDKSKLEIERMKKKVKGLINRLSESNMASISSQIEAMYHSHSRAVLTGALTAIIMEAIIVPELIPEKLVMEQVMLVTVLHHNVAMEIGASFLQSVVQKFHELLSQDGQYGHGKEMENILVLLSNMFNFSIIHSRLIFDLMKKFTENFRERDIQLLLVLLRNVGFRLRKDNAMALKDIVMTIQRKAAEADVTQFEDESRVKFMLEILAAIKNNNMRKIPNFDPSQMEHLRKLLRNYIRGSTLHDEQLNVSLEDLRNAEEKGKWWLIGSAWIGREESGQEEDSSQPAIDNMNEDLLELARRQRMNTDTRRHIFCIIVTCEDYLDAFEKLLKLGLKNQQEREILHVIVDLCLQEKTFNQFYAFLAQKFCEMHRRFQMALQFNVWDQLKELSSFSNTKIDNLAKFLSHLIGHKASSLCLFKVVEFGDLDKFKVRLLKVTIVQLLQNYTEDVIQDVFVVKLKTLREGLSLFMQHFLHNKELQHRMDMAQKSLSAAEGSTKF